jgi:hypothetical protein
MKSRKVEETSTPTCKGCKKIFIKLDALFCPYCGTACIRNQNIKEKTTAHHDPMNPLLKPWRDPPPSISLPPTLRTSTFINKDPWRPIMRNSNKKSVKKKENTIMSSLVLPSLSGSTSPVEDTIINEDTSIENIFKDTPDAVDISSELPVDEFVNFRGCSLVGLVLFV